MCRKFHGAAFGTLVEVEGLQWRSGAELLQDYIGNNGTVRKFCRHCGSSLAFAVADAGADQLEIAVACFDEDIPVKIDRHIYTRYKACWYDPPQDLPQNEEGRSE